MCHQCFVNTLGVFLPQLWKIAPSCHSAATVTNTSRQHFPQCNWELFPGFNMGKCIAHSLVKAWLVTKTIFYMYQPISDGVKASMCTHTVYPLSVRFFPSFPHADIVSGFLMLCCFYCSSERGKGGFGVGSVGWVTGLHPCQTDTTSPGLNQQSFFGRHAHHVRLCFLQCVLPSSEK